MKLIDTSKLNSEQSTFPAAGIAPDHIDPAQWMQAIGIARQACARIFRDGGNPADALRAFGLRDGAAAPADWSKAVSLIAETMCASSQPRAA